MLYTVPAYMCEYTYNREYFSMVQRKSRTDRVSSRRAARISPCFPGTENSPNSRDETRMEGHHTFCRALVPMNVSYSLQGRETGKLLLNPIIKLNTVIHS